MSNVVDIPEEYLPKIDELPGELPRIAKVIEGRYPGMGVPITLLLAQTYPGQPIYLHGVKKITDAVRNDAIRAKYDLGFTVKQLATDTGLSTRQVERILVQAGSDRKKEFEARQGRLF